MAVFFRFSSHLPFYFPRRLSLSLSPRIMMIRISFSMAETGRGDRYVKRIAPSGRVCRSSFSLLWTVLSCFFFPSLSYFWYFHFALDCFIADHSNARRVKLQFCWKENGRMKKKNTIFKKIAFTLCFSSFWGRQSVRIGFSPPFFPSFVHFYYLQASIPTNLMLV